MEPTPITNRLMHHRFWPQLTPVYSGTAESGTYEVQPAAAWPPSTKKPDSMMTPAVNVTQNDSMLRTGKAMSRAPIMSGMQKLPKAPARIGMITKKIMIVACMVNAMLYWGGWMMPGGDVSVKMC